MRYNKLFSVFACLATTLVLSACSETQYAAHVAKQITMPQDRAANSVGSFKVGRAYKIKGERYYPAETYNHTEVGTASWYGPGFHGKQTANGEVFDKNELTAAHRTLQMPSIVKVTNLNNGRSAILRVNDRGPFAHERILDVSERAASVLGFKNQGVAKVRVEVLADASKEVASAAKRGISTRGFEVAYNKNPNKRVTPVKSVRPPPIPSTRQEPVTQVVLSEPSSSVPAVPVQTAGIPVVESASLDNVVQNAASPSIGGVPAANKLYVQVASFAQEANALSYSNTLANYGNSRVYMTRINNQPFFRVRLGPYNDPAQAQQIVTALNEAGKPNAVIVGD